MYCVGRQDWHSWRSGDPASCVDLSVWPELHPTSTMAPVLLSSLQSPAMRPEPAHDRVLLLCSAHDRSMHVAPLGQLAHVDAALFTTA